MTVKRMNHSKYLCSTRHLMLQRNLSQLKCWCDDMENIQHSGKQSSTSTIYLLGVLFGDWLSLTIISVRPKVIKRLYSTDFAGISHIKSKITPMILVRVVPWSQICQMAEMAEMQERSP